MYGTPDVSRVQSEAPSGASQTITQLAAALIELAEAQRATDQKLAQLVAANQEIVALQRAEACTPPVANQAVTVTDVRMTFGSMVVFMVKWVIASIPAAIALAIIAGAVMFGLAILGGILSISMR